MAEDLKPTLILLAIVAIVAIVGIVMTIINTGNKMGAVASEKVVTVPENEIPENLRGLASGCIHGGCNLDCGVLRYAMLRGSQGAAQLWDVYCSGARRR